MIKVGIIGCGFVGGALKAWLEENNKDVQVFVSDPPKGYNDDLGGIDIAFLQMPTSAIRRSCVFAASTYSFIFSSGSFEDKGKTTERHTDSTDRRCRSRAKGLSALMCG